MFRLALVYFCILLSVIDSKHVVVRPVTWHELLDDDVALAQTANFSQNVADGTVERGSVEVKQLDPRNTLEFGTDEESNETETEVELKLKEKMEKESDAKTDTEMKVWTRCKETMEIDTRAELTVKSETKLEEKDTAETKSGFEEGIGMRSGLRANKEELKEEVVRRSKSTSDTKIQARLKSKSEPEVFHSKHTSEFGGARKSAAVKMEVRQNQGMEIEQETKTKAEKVVNAGSNVIAGGDTRAVYKIGVEVEITAKLKRALKLGTGTIAKLNVKGELKPGVEADKDTGRELTESMRSKPKMGAKMEKDDQSERETKEKVELSSETSIETVQSVGIDTKTKLGGNIQAEMNTKRTNVRKESRLEVKKENETKKEEKTRSWSNLGADMKLQLKSKAERKVKVNGTMNFKSKVDIETKMVPVLKTRGFPESITNAFRRTASSLQMPGNIVDLGIQTIQPLVDWMRTTCKYLPVDYNYLTSAYRRLTSNRNRGEIRGGESKNRKTRSPDLGLKTLVQEQDSENSSKRHMDRSEDWVALEIVDEITSPPLTPKSKKMNGRNRNGNQHPIGKGSRVKNGNGVGMPKTQPPSPTKLSWSDLSSEHNGKPEDKASDSDEEDEETTIKPSSGKASSSMVKRKKTPPRDDTYIEGYTLEQQPERTKEESKNHRSASGQSGGPEIGTALKEKLKAQGAAFERMASIEQSIKTAFQDERRRKNGNGSQTSPPKTLSPSPPKSSKESPKEKKMANGGARNDKSSPPKGPVLFPSLSSWRRPPANSGDKQEDTTLDPHSDFNLDEAPMKPSSGLGYRQGQGAPVKGSSSSVQRKKSPPRDDTYIEGYTLTELSEWAEKGSKDQADVQGGKPDSGLTFEERVRRQAAPFERMASIERGAGSAIPVASSRYRNEQFRDPQAWSKLDDKYGPQQAKNK